MHEMIQLVNEMSPFLLLGFLLAGLMHAFIPHSVYGKYLSVNNWRSVLYATLFGIPLPLCSPQRCRYAAKAPARVQRSPS